MVCPFCHSETEVTNSRPQKRTNGVWRRRHCLKCDRIFTSIEKADLSASVRVQKHSGALEPLSEAKLIASLYKTLDHHKNAMEIALELSQTVLLSVMSEAIGAVVLSDTIAKHVNTVLKRFDTAAAIRYQSFRIPLQSKREVRKAIS